ncbi:MAG: hypothetical protein VX016_08685 [Verrucomicrobiota bacterium]|nr:hypothetical protein [Verrucomicrobiota bacterium]
MKKFSVTSILSIILTCSVCSELVEKSFDQDRKNVFVDIAKKLIQSDDNLMSKAIIKQIEEAQNNIELSEAIDQLTLIDVGINPESRVKISSTNSKITLHENVPAFFIIRIDNTAGITAPLNLSPIDLALDPPGSADWCTIKVVNDSNFSRQLNGQKKEYKLMEITAKFSGLREVRITGDAGQGTQDLGFRATTDLILEVKSKK